MRLHPQVRALLDAGSLDARNPRTVDLAALRAGYLDTAMRLGGAPEPVAAIDDVVIARPDGEGMRARAYRPRDRPEPAGALLWLHGGGWVLGDLDGFDRVSRSLANASGAIVVTVEYRLAPEHPFPAAVRDADAAVAWAGGRGAGELGFAADRIAIGGDSAGGNLAAVAARHAPRALRAQLLVYPVTDWGMDSASYAEFASGPLLRADEMSRCWAAYLAGHDGADPDASPLRASDLVGLPPAFIAVAGVDVLRDEGIAYVRRLRAAGVPVTLKRYDDMAHGFLRWGGAVDRARELIDDLGRAARRALGA